MGNGTLTVVGTGIKLITQTTLEARAHIERADRVFYFMADRASEQWIVQSNPRSQSLQPFLVSGQPRRPAYEAMVDHILQAVRSGKQICAVFYGHPGVFVYPAHEAVRRARAGGFKAIMLPGISAEDCLFADLGVDPARTGCQTFDATSFLLFSRKPDVTASLVLWQIGVIGQPEHRPTRPPEGLPVLTDYLLPYYGAEHRVTVYEAAQYPVCDPSIQRVALGKLPECKVTRYSTLYVPPARSPVADAGMLDRLKMAPDAVQHCCPGLDLPDSSS